MKIPALPSDEVQRLKTLRDYDLLDTPPEQALDDLTALAAQICGVPIALVSLVDEHRQWFKSKLGLTVCETPRDISFCGHAILEPRLFLIPDATLDERFADNPLVTGESRIRFYAGAPLTTPSGETLGALCVMDQVPRQLSEPQQQALLRLARQVMSQLELRRQTRELRESEARLQIVTENARVGLFMVNQERRYLYANQAYAELVNRPLSSIFGALLPELLADIYESRVRHQMDRAFAGERITFEVVRHFPDGPHHFSAIYEPRITNGSVTLVVGVITDITERKNAEAASEQRRKELQIILDAVPALVFYKDRESRFLRVNRELADVVGLPPEDFIGKTDTDMGAPDAERYRKDDLRVMTSGEPLRQIEERIHTAKGIRWLLTDKIPHRDENGHITGITGFAVDITERKHAEEALQRSQADLQLALQAARLGRWNWDILTGEVTWSPECLAIYGLPPDASMDYAWFLSILHPDDRPHVEAALAQAVEKRAAYDAEKRVIWPDGSVRWTASRGQVYCNAAHEPTRLTGVTFDITHHKQAEAALREALERFQIVARATNDAVWDWNLLTDAVWWNEGFQTLFGYPLEETASTGKAWISLLHPDDCEKIYASVHHAIHGRDQAWLHEYRFRRKDGAYAHVFDRGYIIRDEHGKPVRMIGAMQDITERKRAEERAHWLATFPERNPNPVLELDLDSGIFNYLNPAALRQFPDLPARGIHHPLVKGISELIARLAEKKTVHREITVGDFCFSQMITYLPDVGRVRVYSSDITERRKAEFDLLEAHRLAKLGNWEWDIGTGRHRWSPEVFAIYGRDPALGPVGVPEVSSYFTPESWQRLNATIETGIANQAPYEIDVEVVRSDGTHRWVTARGEISRDAAGKMTGLRGSVQDITERKEVEEALRLRQKYAHGLLQFSQQLERAETLVQVLQAARTALQSALGLSRIWFYQLSADQQHLKLILADHATGLPPAHQPEQLFPIKGDRMLEEIASSRDIVVVTDARTDPRTDQEIVARLGSRTIVNVPVALAGKKLGTIGTGTFGDEGVRHLSSLECEFLSALASHAAAVIDRVTAAQARNQAELALRASEERLRTVTDTAQVGLVIVDEQHRYRYANPSYARILRLPTHEIVGQRVADVLPEVYPEQIRPRLDRAFAGERVSYELSITSPVTGESGRYYVVTYEPKKDHPDPVVVIVIVDITERKYAEDRLRASEGRYRALFDCAPDGIIVADPQGTYLDANTSVLRMLGYAHEEFIGLNAAHIVVPAEVAHIEPALSKINSGTDYHREWQFRRKDGSTFAAEVIATLMPDGNLLAMIRDITERKQAEDELRRTNALLHAVADGTADAVFVKDLEGRYLLFNEAASRFAGRLPAEVLGKDDTALFDAEGAKQVMAHDRAVRESGQSQTNEECLTAAAVTRTYLATKSPYRDAQGNIIGTIGISHDITQRKRTEEALRNSEIRFHTVWETANDALRLVDENGVIVAVNEAFCRLVGVSRKELEGRPFTETYLGDRNPLELQQRFQERFRERRIPAHEERRMTFRAGNTVELEITSTFVELPGHPALLFGLFRDVTERKRAEQDLRESRRLLEKAQEVGHVGSWISDSGLTRKLTWSAETCRIFGLAPEEFGGNVEAFLSLVHPEDRKAIEEASLAALAGERLYNLEHRIVRPDGSLRWVHEQADVERNSAGQPVRMVGVVQDITERRQLEEQFRQAQKMDAIGQLAGGVAHDFNNILAAMMMQTELLSLTDDLPLEVQDGLQDIQASAERAANLTRQLLLFSRKQVMYTRELDLNEAVTSLFKMLQRIIGEHLDLQFNLCPRSLNVHADPGMLDQVLMNLVVNARDAMPNGGRITIITTNKNLTKEEAAALPETSPGRYACMQVTDTGCGIPPENLTRIFEPFFTTKDPGKGTGLGLATVFGIVKQHGGTVIVESEVGRGTSFQILFPIAQSVEKPAEKVTARAKPRGGTETILLVEDDPSVRMLTRIVLERAGYRIVEAINGVEALELWAEHQDSIRLLLTDIVMPEGVSGRELATRLQAQNPKLRVVFTSGYSADIAGRELALEEGQNFIQKPAPPHKLLETVRHSLDDAR